MAETRASKQLTRDQFAIIAGEEKGQPQRIRALEDLVASVNTDPVEAVSSPVSGNTTYTISNVIGFQSILIRKANLVASAGGPFTLTITTGSGDVVYVPIAAFGDTILSGDLLFDVYVDSSGNVESKDWEIEGSNVRGTYRSYPGGHISQIGVYSASVATVNPLGAVFFVGIAFTYPVPIAIAPYSITPNCVPTAGLCWAGNAQVITLVAFTGVLIGMTAVTTGMLNFNLESRWRI